MPAFIKKKGGAKAERQWKHVYDSCMVKYGDKEKCYRMATGVASKNINEEFRDAMLKDK